MKKIVCFVLAFIMAFTTNLSVFAAELEPYSPVILEDTEAVRITKTSDNEFTYVATYDKINNTVQLVQIDNITGEENAGEITQIQIFTTDIISRVRASMEEKTFTNYEYKKTYGNPNEWELRRPGDNVLSWVYFQTYETSDNEEDLVAFKKAVDDINAKEGAIVGAFGMTGLSYLAAGAAGAGAIFTGGTLTGAAWGAILSAGGFTTAYLTLCMAYDQSCKNAYDAYWEVYYNSEIL